MSNTGSNSREPARPTREEDDAAWATYIAGRNFVETIHNLQEEIRALQRLEEAARNDQDFDKAALYQKSLGLVQRRLASGPERMKAAGKALFESNIFTHSSRRGQSSRNGQSSRGGQSSSSGDNGQNGQHR